MWEAINSFLTTVDNLVWGVPLMVLIMAGGILLTVRLGLLQIRRLPATPHFPAQLRSFMYSTERYNRNR